MSGILKEGRQELHIQPGCRCLTTKGDSLLSQNCSINWNPQNCTWYEGNDDVIQTFCTRPTQNISSTAMTGFEVTTASGFAATALSRKRVACTQVLCSCTHAIRRLHNSNFSQLGTEHSWALQQLSQPRTSRTSSGSAVEHSMLQHEQ